MSAFGDLSYPADFPHFGYVNPKAPKGGVFSQIGPNRQFNQSFQTFNSLNSFILKGDAAQGMELTFAGLMVRSGDEPDAMYGLLRAKVRELDAAMPVFQMKTLGRQLDERSAGAVSDGRKVHVRVRVRAQDADGHRL